VRVRQAIVPKINEFEQDFQSPPPMMPLRAKNRAWKEEFSKESKSSDAVTEAPR